MWRKDNSFIRSINYGIEKIVHDYDLVLNFIQEAFNISLDTIVVSSEAQNKFWIPEREKEITERIESDPALYAAYHMWDSRMFQRIVESPFVPDSDLIPDYQMTKFIIDGNIPIEFEVSCGGFRSKTERVYEFFGSDADIIIDIINGTMTILYNTEKAPELYSLSGDGTSHAGGDYFVMDTFLRLLRNDKTCIHPNFDEVIRSTHIGILAEESIKEKKEFIYTKN